VVELPARPREEAGAEVEESPLYGVAMLKIAMELKKPGARELDEILSGVLARMGLSEDAFREYLERNGGLLKTIAQKKRY
jgi:hypothetical protein